MKRLRRLVYATIALLAVLLPQADQGMAYAENADSFGLPLTGYDWLEGYDVQNGSLGGNSSCYGQHMSKIWHAGEDWGTKAGTIVHAIANGKVVYADPNFNYPGRVVIVEHVLPSGQRLYSQYGHLASPLLIKRGDVVRKGDPLGRVLNQGSNSHLHWEIRDFFDGSNLCSRSGVPGPGYTYPEHPNEKGYLAPSRFVKEYRAGPPELSREPVKVEYSMEAWFAVSDRRVFTQGDTPRLCYELTPKVAHHGVISFSSNDGAWLSDWEADVSADSPCPDLQRLSVSGKREYMVEAYVDGVFVARVSLEVVINPPAAPQVQSRPAPTPTPRPAPAQPVQQPPLAPPPQVQTRPDYILTARFDPAGPYYPGQSMYLKYEMSPPVVFQVKITYTGGISPYVHDGPGVGVFRFDLDAAAAAGRRQARIEAFVEGQRVAVANASADIVRPQQNLPMPTPVVPPANCSYYRLDTGQCVDRPR